MNRKTAAGLVLITLMLLAGSTSAFTLKEGESMDFVDGIKVTLKSASRILSFRVGYESSATFSVYRFTVQLNCAGWGDDLRLTMLSPPSQIGWCYFNNKKVIGIKLTRVRELATHDEADFAFVYNNQTFETKDDIAIAIAAARKAANAIEEIEAGAGSVSTLTGFRAIVKKKDESISFADLTVEVTELTSYSAKFKVTRGERNVLDCGPAFTPEATLRKDQEAVCRDESIQNAEILKIKAVDFIEGKAYFHIFYPMDGDKFWEDEGELIKAYPTAVERPPIAYFIRQGTSTIEEDDKEFNLHLKDTFSLVFDNLLVKEKILFGSKDSLDKFIEVWKEEHNVEDITQDPSFFKERITPKVKSSFEGNLIIPETNEDITFGVLETYDNDGLCKRNDVSLLQCTIEINKINSVDIKDSPLDKVTIVSLIDLDGDGKLDREKEYKEFVVDLKSAIGRGYIVIRPINMIEIGNAGYASLDEYAQKLVVKKGAVIIAQHKDNVAAGQGTIFVLEDQYIVVNGLEGSTDYTLFHGSKEGYIKVGEDDPDLILGVCNETQTVAERTVGGKKILYCE